MKIGLGNIALVATLSCLGIASCYNLVETIKNQEIENRQIEELRQKDPALVEALNNFQKNNGGGLKKDEFIKKRVLETKSMIPLDSAIAAEKEKSLKRQKQVQNFFKNVKKVLF